ncbi:hypothetical protein [Streptomyces sp. NPDC093808]|uniref:hypothetical protein n=1 Tax=Streptomyces sp. NPDC093808 TaxID=3154985 RepID=UPI00344D4056
MRVIGMTAAKRVPTRLLDGRQSKIMSLAEQGHDQQARNMIDATQPTEPWKNAIGLLCAHIELCSTCRFGGAVVVTDR